MQQKHTGQIMLSMESLYLKLIFVSSNQTEFLNCSTENLCIYWQGALPVRDFHLFGKRIREDRPKTQETVLSLSTIGWSRNCALFVLCLKMYQALKTIPSKENLLYLSVAYARKGDYKKAFELMAGEPFFPSPVLSNSLYKYLNLPVFHRDYIK